MPSGEGWHRGDRLLHRPSGQRGVVMGWKASRLFVYWGSHDCRRVEGWVADEDCVWEPSPVEVLSAKGEHMATVQQGVRPAPNSPVLTPTPMNSREIVLPE